MERILAATDGSDTTLSVALHAINLAKRIRGRVTILLVFPLQTGRNAEHQQEGAEGRARRRIESLIAQGRSEGVVVDYYMAYGNYARELAKFVDTHGTTLLVVSSPSFEKKIDPEQYNDFLKRVQQNNICRIEVVHERPFNKTLRRG